MQILREAGAKQVSADAVEELRRTLEKVALQLAKSAVLFADDAARLRVSASDVRRALEEFEKETAV